MPSERKQHRVYYVLFDMDGRTEGDFGDFRRALDRLEADFPGAHLVGSDETASWPSIRVTESTPPRAAEGLREEVREGTGIEYDSATQQWWMPAEPGPKGFDTLREALIAFGELADTDLRARLAEAERDLERARREAHIAMDRRDDAEGRAAAAVEKWEALRLATCQALARVEEWAPEHVAHAAYGWGRENTDAGRALANLRRAADVTVKRDPLQFLTFTKTDAAPAGGEGRDDA